MSESSAVIVSGNVREYFHDQIDSALHNQSVDIDDTTSVYLVNLLVDYTRARSVFEKTDDGLALKPLALYLADAVNTDGPLEKSIALRRLGDIALFISGLFSGSLSRKLVDVDYYIAMGGNAYSAVHDIVGDYTDGQSLYAELAAKFALLVDVLNEVGDASNLSSNGDILRTYEIWLKTGSTRASDKLRRFGISPINSSQAQH